MPPLIDVVMIDILLLLEVFHHAIVLLILVLHPLEIQMLMIDVSGCMEMMEAPYPELCTSCSSADVRDL